MKAIDATKPITVVIQNLVDDPLSELRGVTDSTKQSEINSTCEVSNETARKAHGSNRLDESNPAVLELASNSAQNRSYGNSSADWTLVLKKGKPK